MPRHCTSPAPGTGMTSGGLVVAPAAPWALGAFCSQPAANKAATVIARRAPLVFCIGEGASLEYASWANTMVWSIAARAEPVAERSGVQVDDDGIVVGG